MHGELLLISSYLEQEGEEVYFWFPFLLLWSTSKHQKGLAELTNSKPFTSQVSCDLGQLYKYNRGTYTDDAS